MTDKPYFCAWMEDEEGAWTTECDNLFEFGEGGPPENDFEYCPFCGRSLKTIRWIAEDNENTDGAHD